MSTALHLILLAGGQGLRAGGANDVPKQFRPTGRGLLFAVSLHGFLSPAAGSDWQVASLIVTAPDDWRNEIEAELSALEIPWHVAAPGESRTASTWSATVVLDNEVGPQPGDLVAVHDAARPFATVGLLDALVQTALDAGGAIPGVPVPDTIVQSTGGAATYLRRDSLLAVQTPQVFRWSVFEPAHRWAHAEGQTFTDDGGLMAARGHQPVVVPGEPGNWKVTSAGDWERAAGLLE